jgi:hypothetical protein
MTATLTYDQAESYLETRAYNEGISVDDLLDMTPTSVSDHPVESAMFWQQRDYSHKLPTSLYPDMADDPDNAMPEDPSVNRARGADIMTSEEEYLATLDNELLATEIDISYSGDVDGSLDFISFGLF